MLMRKVTIQSRLGEITGYRNDEFAYFDLFHSKVGRDVRHFVLLKLNIKLMYEPYDWMKNEWYADLIAIEYLENDVIRLKDLYLDIYIEGNGPTYRLVDFEDLAQALMNNETNVQEIEEPLKNLQLFLNNSTFAA
ncbi:hypothetical protein D7M11_34455 [Paenibacillus ginsengarvi]|uniref:DUF402 domain-containing protein n=2 Tax=Paenibacillus ginsengarvi TaxID=400777 RepID=A0A3B0AVR1_9BACL|nr:hypothetical protein D7M11_34455 [Paenibacillus ginsengarvi]